MKRPVFCPFRIKKVRLYTQSRKPILLDVGCGNNSPSITKHWLANCVYHGIDQDKNNLSSSDENSCERFIELNLDCKDLSTIQDNFYDAIIMSHIVEHLKNGAPVIGELTKKLKPGGVFYIEFPSERSLYLPRGTGTLNFYDDKTHIQFYSLGEIGNILLDNHLTVIEAGRHREWHKVLLSPVFLPLQIKTLIMDRRLHARGLWDILGVADYIIAIKPPQEQ